MENLSILNPPITDLLNYPRVTSEALLKDIDKQDTIIAQRLAALADQVTKEHATPLDVMMFACLQHHLHVTTLNTKLTARQMDLVYVTNQLSLGLERLTKRLIWLTVALGILAVPLAIEVILKWFK